MAVGIRLQYRTLPATRLGNGVILPSSYIGSRFLLRFLQTPSIEVELYPGRSTADRPDFIIRAFHMKVRMLYEGLCKDGIFGHAVAREYQTRSLLHMHLHLFPEDHRFLF
jgi:hypothetical protein